MRGVLHSEMDTLCDDALCSVLLFLEGTGIRKQLLLVNND